MKELVYIEKPPGFKGTSQPTHVYHLNRALYRLRQAACAWYDKFAQFLLTMDFQANMTYSSLFTCRRDDMVTLLYMDDIILTGNSQPFLQQFLTIVQQQFSMNDLGPLHYFLDIQIVCSPSSIFLHQHKYASDIIAWAHMTDYNPRLPLLLVTPPEILVPLSCI